MVQRAEELGLPLFTVPLDVAFRRITAYVYNALTSQDMYRLRRSLSLQSHLLELLIEERGLEELIANLAVLLDTTVLLFDGQGTLLSEATHQARLSAQAHRAVWDAYLEHRGSPQLNQTVHVTGFRVSYREVALYGHVDRVLVAAYANRPIPELAETTLSFAQKLLTLDRLRERDVLALHHRMRTGLMDDLVSGIGSERELDQRMRQYGLEPERPYRLAVLVAEDPALEGAALATAGASTPALDRPPAARAHDEERILRFTASFQQSVDDFLSRHGLAYLTVPKGDAIVVLVQFLDPAWTEAERTISALADVVERTLPDTRLRVGVSGPATGPAAARGAFQQAREAADMAGGRRRANRVRFFDQLHPQNRLLESQSTESLRAIYNETLAPLVDARPAPALRSASHPRGLPGRGPLHRPRGRHAAPAPQHAQQAAGEDRGTAGAQPVVDRRPGGLAAGPARLRDAGRERGVGREPDDATPIDAVPGSPRRAARHDATPPRSGIRPRLPRPRGARPMSYTLVPRISTQ